MNELLEQVRDYADELDDFISLHKLPAKWFTKPDHIAIKAVDGAGFEMLTDLFDVQSELMTCIEMDGRRLATAKLIAPISVGKLGMVSWVELMEPRPEKVGQDVVGFEHMEFTFADFESVRNYLGLKDVDVVYTNQHNAGHAWINIVINNSTGQELKLNDRSLADVVMRELEEGLSYLL